MALTYESIKPRNDERTGTEEPERWKPVDASIFGEEWELWANSILYAAETGTLPIGVAYLIWVIVWEVANECRVPEGFWVRPTSEVHGPLRNPDHWVVEPIGDWEGCVPMDDEPCVNPAHFEWMVDGDWIQAVATIED